MRFCGIERVAVASSTTYAVRAAEQSGAWAPGRSSAGSSCSRPDPGRLVDAFLVDESRGAA